MAEIAYIHGLTAQMTDDERKQRGAEVPPMKPLDYLRMTEGEMRLSLVAEQLNILRNYYAGTSEARQYNKGFELVTDALAAGVHGASGIGVATGTGSILATVVNQIRLAKRATAPAAGTIYTDKRKNIAGGLVPILDCDVLYPIMTSVQWNNVTHNPSGYAGYYRDVSVKKHACVAENVWRKLLNDDVMGIEKIAHHPLYEFVENPNGMPGVVSAKSVLHKNSISSLNSLTKISHDNIRLWQRNGIMRENSHKNGGPISPENSILAIKQAQAEGIGFLPIPIVIAILSAVTAALSAAVKFIAMLKQKQPTAEEMFRLSTQGWGNQNWGPEKLDWANSGGGGGGNGGGGNGNDENGLFSSENMPLLLAAGAGIFLMSSK